MDPRSLFRLLDRVGPVSRIALGGAAHRGELASLELGEACDHLSGSFALGLGASVLAVLGGFALNFSVAAAVWHREDRGLILLLLALVQLAAAAALVVVCARRLRRWHPLAETRRQLREDCDCLQNLTPSRHPQAEESPVP